MSRAYKCDRCGRLFEVNLVTHENRQEYKVYKQVGNPMHDIAAEYEYDFCGSCQRAFEDFLAERTYSPGEVEKVLAIHGQKDKRFNIGEMIRYSPSEVCKILKGETENV